VRKIRGEASRSLQSITLVSEDVLEFEVINNFSRSLLRTISKKKLSSASS
jgi:hypothetical protein